MIGRSSLLSLCRPAAILRLQQRQKSGRDDIRKYVEPPKFKKHMLAACEPYFKAKITIQEEVCKGTKVLDKPLLPLEIIYVNELVEELSKSEFVLFIHYLHTPFQSDRKYKNTLTKLHSKFITLNNRVYRETFKALGREEVNHFFIGRNALITGKLEHLPPCIKALKKMPQYLLLAGLVEKNLYKLEQLQAISESSNIDQCRANLLSILDTPAVNLASNLDFVLESMKEKGE